MFLLVLLISNCDSSKHAYNSNNTGKITLAQLEHQLKSGPIFIGENHSNKFAQNAIKALIKKGLVQKFFIELPNNTDLPNEEELRRDLCKKQASYLSDTNRTPNKQLEAELEMTFDGYDKHVYGLEGGTGTLLQTALDQGGVAIYFHDVPSRIGGDIWINKEWKKDSYGSTTEGAIERNKYSANLIKQNNPGPGTIVLAGMSHLNPIKMGNEDTLQALLGYKNDHDRVFDLTSKDAL